MRWGVRACTTVRPMPWKVSNSSNVQNGQCLDPMLARMLARVPTCVANAMHAGMSAADRESSLRGTELAVRALVAAGAESLGPVNSGPSLMYRPAEGGLEALEGYIGRIRANGIVANKTQVLTSHHPRKPSGCTGATHTCRSLGRQLAERDSYGCENCAGHERASDGHCPHGG